MRRTTEGLRTPTTSGSTEEVEVGILLRLTVIIRDSLDGDEEAGDKPRRTNSTRERCREEIPALEDRLAAICEETTQLEELVKLKHSNLAGHRGHSYDWKVHSFSLETEKLSTAAQVNLLHDLYLERKKTKTQQQAEYVKFLRQTYLPIKEEYLQILKAEDFELETEISRIHN